MDKVALDLHGKKVAVISDIHSNASALKEVKKELKKNKIDCVVVLGMISHFLIKCLIL